MRFNLSVIWEKYLWWGSPWSGPSMDTPPRCIPRDQSCARRGGAAGSAPGVLHTARWTGYTYKIQSQQKSETFKKICQFDCYQFTNVQCTFFLAYCVEKWRQNAKGEVRTGDRTVMKRCEKRFIAHFLYATLHCAHLFTFAATRLLPIFFSLRQLVLWREMEHGRPALYITFQ